MYCCHHCFVHPNAKNNSHESDNYPLIDVKDKKAPNTLCKMHGVKPF